MQDRKYALCPFCDGYTIESLLTRHPTLNNLSEWCIVCVRCGAKGPLATSEDGAKSDWNKRGITANPVGSNNVIHKALAEENAKTRSECRRLESVIARETANLHQLYIDLAAKAERLLIHAQPDDAWRLGNVCRHQGVAPGGLCPTCHYVVPPV